LKHGRMDFPVSERSVGVTARVAILFRKKASKQCKPVLTHLSFYFRQGLKKDAILPNCALCRN
ncbi:MAG: hypothetical protein MJK04_05195, partial [Psychrosphaera sp.]|nr:hypothetical protein [Psychrosphaera sp.]